MRNFPIWLFGLPNSGKTTLAVEISKRLTAKGVKHELIDGDQVRAFFRNDLGFTPDDRRRNIRRIIFAAMLLTRHDVPVIVANVLPFEDMRAELREKLPQARQVYLKASLDACRSRDASKKALQGTTNTFGAGIDFEEPAKTDLTLDTERESNDVSLRRLLDYIDLKS